MATLVYLTSSHPQTQPNSHCKMRGVGHNGLFIRPPAPFCLPNQGLQPTCSKSFQSNCGGELVYYLPNLVP